MLCLIISKTAFLYISWGEWGGDEEAIVALFKERLSFHMQVYNETIRDLLMPGQPLAVREDPQRGVCVSSLTLHKVLSRKFPEQK